MPAVDRGSSQDGREHGFADSGRSDEQHVGRVGEVGACGEFSDEFELVSSCWVRGHRHSLPTDEFTVPDGTNHRTYHCMGWLQGVVLAVR